MFEQKHTHKKKKQEQKVQAKKCQEQKVRIPFEFSKEHLSFGQRFRAFACQACVQVMPPTPSRFDVDNVRVTKAPTLSWCWHFFGFDGLKGWGLFFSRFLEGLVVGMTCGLFLVFDVLLFHFFR